MAHLIDQMAYVGTTPWHGLGSALSPKQPLEIWQREAGMDWQIQESPVHFKADAIGHHRDTDHSKGGVQQHPDHLPERRPPCHQGSAQHAL